MVSRSGSSTKRGYDDVSVASASRGCAGREPACPPVARRRRRWRPGRRGRRTLWSVPRRFRAQRPGRGSQRSSCPRSRRGVSTRSMRQLDQEGWCWLVVRSGGFRRERIRRTREWRPPRAVRDRRSRRGSTAGGGPGGSAPAGELAIEIKGFGGRLVLVLAPLVAGDHPHDLELVAVGVLAVQRLRGTVVALARRARRAGPASARRRRGRGSSAPPRRGGTGRPARARGRARPRPPRTGRGRGGCRCRRRGGTPPCRGSLDDLEAERLLVERGPLSASRT